MNNRSAITSLNGFSLLRPWTSVGKGLAFFRVFLVAFTFTVCILSQRPVYAQRKPDCLKIAVLSKPYENTPKAKLVSEIWRKKATSLLNDCSDILSYKASMEAFAYLYSSHKEAIEHLPLSSDKLDYLHDEFQITHIAIATYQNLNGGRVKIQSKIIATTPLGWLVPIDDKLSAPYTFRLGPKLSLSKQFQTPASQFLWSFLPNSIAVGVGSLAPSNKKVDELYEEISSKERNLLPFSGTLYTVFPPRFLDDGDSKFFLTTSFNFSRSDTDFIYKKKKEDSLGNELPEEENSEINYRLRYTRFSPSLSLMWARQTWAGQFRLGLGYGGIIYEYKDNYSNVNSGISGAIKLTLSYHAFMSRNFYFLLLIAGNSPSEAFISNEIFEIGSDIEVFLGIGYYIDNLFHPGGYVPKL